MPWRAISASVWAWMPDAGDAGAPPQPVVAVVDGGEALLIDPGPSEAHGQQVQQALDSLALVKAQMVARTAQEFGGVDFSVRRESVQLVQANTQLFKVADHLMPVGMVYG